MALRVPEGGKFLNAPAHAGSIAGESCEERIVEEPEAFEHGKGAFVLARGIGMATHHPGEDLLGLFFGEGGRYETAELVRSVAEQFSQQHEEGLRWGVCGRWDSRARPPGNVAGLPDTRDLLFGAEFGEEHERRRVRGIAHERVDNRLQLRARRAADQPQRLAGVARAVGVDARAHEDGADGRLGGALYQ